MSSFFKRSLARAGGLAPLYIMLLLLLATEILLHLDPVWKRAAAWSDALWIDRFLTSRAEVFMPYHQDIEEEPINEAFLRAIARSPKKHKVLVFGDSTVWGVHKPPAFNQLLAPVLERSMDSREVGCYSLAMVAENNVSAFYLLKRALDHFTPDLVIYEANPFFMGAFYGSRIRRQTGFIDTNFFSPAEERAYHRLLSENQPVKNQVVDSFRLAHFGWRLEYGSGIRRLLLPPARLILGSECYFPECRTEQNVYWKDILDNEERMNSVDHKNIQSFTIDESSLNFTYLLLVPELLHAREIPVVMLIPPKNLEMLDLLGVKEVNLEAGDRLDRELAGRGVAVINCQESAPENYFQDTQHFLAGGHRVWVSCIEDSRAVIDAELGKFR